VSEAVWILVGGVLGAAAAAFGMLGTVRRVVRRQVRAERRARDAARLAEIGSMTKGLAHEIKNPLSTIGLNAQLLGEALEELEIDPGERERLVRRAGSLSREVERLREILEDFLRYAGEFRLAPGVIDLGAEVFLGTNEITIGPNERFAYVTTEERGGSTVSVVDLAGGAGGGEARGPGGGRGAGVGGRGRGEAGALESRAQRDAGDGVGRGRAGDRGVAR